MKTISFQIDQALLDKIDARVTPSKNRSQIMRQILYDHIEGIQPVEVLLKKLLDKLNSMEVVGNV